MRRLAFPKSKFRKIESLLKLMEQTALKYNIDKSQIPILWVIAKGAVPIIGITKPVYAERLAEALQVDLTPEEIEQLTSEAAATGIRQQGSWEPQ
jgi:aryl-alcohol dehydrogenase-like predicted oxidoreductase